MEERGLKPYYVHKNGGIAKSTISQLLNGKQQKVTLDLLFQFTSTLNISLKDFFDDPIFGEITD